jgi:glycerol kinase
MDDADADSMYSRWDDAVERSLDWAVDDENE